MQVILSASGVLFVLGIGFIAGIGFEYYVSKKLFKRKEK